MNYFPTSLALGGAFCNRTQELKRLIHNIESTNPVLIMSPRRFGKTSLAINAIKKTAYPYSHVDFYKALSEQDIELALLNGVSRLLIQLESTPKKLLKLATDFFADLHVRVVFEKAGFSIDLGKRIQKPSDTILLALEKLHHLAKQKKQRVVLFLDEFQSLIEVVQDHSIEAVIREVAQQSTHVAYIFSGSSRHLLDALFNDKKRPFYKLTDTIVLDRIAVAAYYKHLNKAAKARWGTVLDTTLLDLTLSLTEQHPYYVNKLCSLVWLEDTVKFESIAQLWQDYIIESRSSIERELTLLSLNQRKLLFFIARHAPMADIYQKDVLAQIGLSSSSLSRAITALKDKDYIYQNDAGYNLLDPLIKAVLCLE